MHTLLLLAALGVTPCSLVPRDCARVFDWEACACLHDRVARPNRPGPRVSPLGDRFLIELGGHLALVVEAAELGDALRRVAEGTTTQRLSREGWHLYMLEDSWSRP